jgi:Gram-negative porin
MKIRFAVVAAASALAALPMWAQTTVSVSSSTNITIGGLIAMGVKNAEISQGNASAARVTANETGVYDNTSRLWFTSTSKIADGWNVFMRIESRMPMNVRPGDALLQNVGGVPAGIAVNDASGWADGDSWAGIGTPYGNFYAGHCHLYVTDGISVGYLAPSLEHPGEGYRVWDVQALGIFNILDTYMTGKQDGTSLMTKQNTLAITRSRNVIKWDSLTFKPDASSMLNFSLAWSKNVAGAQNVWVSNANGTTYEGGQTIFGKALYNGYGVSAMAVYVDQKFQGVASTAANTELKAMRLGASYKWNGIKAGLIYDNTSMVNGGLNAAGAIIGNSGRTAFQVPVSYQWGDHGVYATYTLAGKTESQANTAAKQMTFAYDYALTKRAFLGVALTTINNDSRVNYQGFLTGYSAFGTSSLSYGESWRQLSLSLNYWF